MYREVRSFFQQNTTLCYCTAGIAIVGYMGYRVVCWVSKAIGLTDKIENFRHNSRLIYGKKRELDLPPLMTVVRLTLPKNSKWIRKDIRKLVKEPKKTSDYEEFNYAENRLWS